MTLRLRYGAGYAITAFFIISLLGCNELASNSDSWRQSSDSIGWIIVDTTGNICSDCIILEEVVRIGDDDGPGYHTPTRWAARDSLGNHWVANSSGPKVYGPRGDFLKQVGRTGEGPLEFLRSGPIFVDGNGRIHVFDPGTARETILAPDGQLISEFAIPGVIYDAIFAGDGDRKLVNMAVRKSNQFGMPVHLLDRSEVVASFESPVSGLLSANIRQLTTDHYKFVYAAQRFDYSVEIWNSEGRRVKGLRREGLWELPPDGQPRPLIEGNSPNGVLLDITVDGENDLLWVSTWLPRLDWREHVTEERMPDGIVVLRPDSNDGIYRQALEVIDLSENKVIARHESSELITSFMGSDLAIGDVVTAAGFPRMVVWSISFNPRVEE